MSDSICEAYVYILLLFYEHFKSIIAEKLLIVQILLLIIDNDLIFCCSGAICDNYIMTFCINLLTVKAQYIS